MVKAVLAFVVASFFAAFAVVLRGFMQDWAR